MTAALTKRGYVRHHSLQTPHPSEDAKEPLDPGARSVFTQAGLPSWGVVRWPGQPTAPPSPCSHSLLKHYDIHCHGLVQKEQRQTSDINGHSVHERPMAPSATKLKIHFDFDTVR